MDGLRWLLPQVYLLARKARSDVVGSNNQWVATTIKSQIFELSFTFTGHDKQSVLHTVYPSTILRCKLLVWMGIWQMRKLKLQLVHNGVNEYLCTMPLLTVSKEVKKTRSLTSQANIISAESMSLILATFRFIGCLKYSVFVTLLT